MPENIRCNSAQERDMEPVHRLTFCLIWSALWHCLRSYAVVL
jgi:hypothetical protein